MFGFELTVQSAFLLGVLLELVILLVILIIRRLIRSFVEDWMLAVSIVLRYRSGFWEGTLPIEQSLVNKYWFCRIPGVIGRLKSQAAKLPKYSVTSRRELPIYRGDLSVGEE